LSDSLGWDRVATKEKLLKVRGKNPGDKRYQAVVTFQVQLGFRVLVIDWKNEERSISLFSFQQVPSGKVVSFLQPLLLNSFVHFVMPSNPQNLETCMS